jgi:hypothetical protein
MQPYIATKRVSLPNYAKHTNMCIEHMRKITANDTHAHDDICFAAGTKIATIFGYKNIENINIMDWIITPFGLGKVTSCGLTKKDAIVITKFGLTATPGHKIFTNIGFRAIGIVGNNANIDLISLSGLLQWRYKKLLYSMPSLIDSWGREDIILAKQLKIKDERVLKDFMLQFGNFIAGKEYKKAILFTIEMAIMLITTIATWNVFQGNNILSSILQKGKVFQHLKSKRSIWKGLENKQNYGIGVMKEGHGIKKMLKVVYAKLESLIVWFVGKNLKHECQNQNIVVMNASNKMMLERQESDGKQKQSELLQDVYNLTVSGYGVYYANGVLVSNCDTLYDGVKLSLMDGVIQKMEIKEGEQHSSAVIRILSKQINKIQSIKSSRYDFH